jgi:nickel transport protein
MWLNMSLTSKRLFRPGRLIRLGAALYIGLGLIASPLPVQAHGADIQYEIFGQEIRITAVYDSGEPMAGAQVTVYAPDEPSVPWLSGICDEQGRFTFTPDAAIPGSWAVQVRQAGHGDMVHIPVGDNTTASDGGGGFTTLQIIIMSACVIWGFVGTALFFARKKA